MSTWSEYGLADDVDAVSVYRVSDLTPEERARVVGTARSMLGHRFDDEFRLAPQDGSTYCSLLALRCLGSADRAIFQFVRARRVPMFDEPVYLPESLLAWPRLANIADAAA